MSVRYDLTAVEILKLLGYTEPVGKDAILQAEQDKAVKLPHALFEFWSLAADCPLFETADIWTKKRDFFWFTYNDIQEWIDCEKKYWEKAPRWTKYPMSIFDTLTGQVEGLENLIL